MAPYDPAQQEVRHLLEGPSATHLLGTDDLGRDTLSRLIYGAQPALAVGMIATGLALLVGTALGLVAGYKRGLVDATLMRIMDGLLAVPTLVLALAITSALGPGLGNAMLAIGVTGIPVFAGLVRDRPWRLAVSSTSTRRKLSGTSLARVAAARLTQHARARILLVEDASSLPSVLQVVLDTTDARGLAEFYRKLLGYVYRAGDEPPAGDKVDERGQDWLVLHHPSGLPRIAFQQVQALRRSTWPQDEVPQQLHLDMTVPTFPDLEIHHERAVELGATLLYDRSHDEQEPLRVYADPAGHPFCIFVAGV